MSLTTSDALRKLQADWNNAKSQKDWTQAKMAEKLGISQPSFNQYLNGKIPLNVEFLLRYSKLRKIDPKVVGVSDNVTQVEVNMIALPVKFSSSGIFYRGSKVVMVASVPNQKDNLFMVEIDSDFRTFPKNAHLICSNGRASEGMMVAAELRDRVVIGVLKKTPDGWAVIQPLVTGDLAVTIDTSWKVYPVEGIHLKPAESGEVFGAK